MSNKKLFVLVMVLLTALMAACQPTGAEPGVDETSGTSIPESTEIPAVETPAGNSADTITSAATAYLAGELGVTAEEIEVVSAEPTEFSDSCLGLGGPAESCLQAITPGWLVMLSVAGQEYELHTDETGQQVRLAVETPVGDGSDTISGAVQEFLSAELGVALGDVQVISATPAEFTDSCLGLGGPAESCLQAITPGWLVMVDVAGQQYEVHTGATGEQVRVAEDVPADDGAANTAVAAAQEYLVAQLGVALGDVQVVSTEPTEFSDGCLGLGRPDESCLQAITPGWLIMVEVAGQEYEVRTDQTGQQVRMAQ